MTKAALAVPGLGPGREGPERAGGRLPLQSGLCSLLRLTPACHQRPHVGDRRLRRGSGSHRATTQTVFFCVFAAHTFQVAFLRHFVIVLASRAQEKVMLRRAQHREYGRWHRDGGVRHPTGNTPAL